MRYRDGYYYLFLSSGTTLRGVESTYHVVVGRSHSPTGPYVDDQARDMRAPDRGYWVIAGSADFAGPGHNTIAIDDAGNLWLVYHAWDRRNVAAGRLLMIDRLIWDREGWPDVPGGQPHHKPFG